MEIDINLSEVQGTDRWVQLLLKYLRQDITPDEQLQLNNWVAAHPSHKEVFDRLNNEAHLLHDLQLLKQVNMEKGWQTIIDRQARLAFNVPRSAFSLFLRRWYVSVAAVLLLIISLFTGRYFYHTSTHKGINEKPVASFLNRPPGGNKATLTLSNGAVIDLDNTANGAIVEEGSSKVVKLKEGQLQYITGNNGNSNAFNTLATPRGGQYQLVLPDGSKVWLNAASSIRYPAAFTSNERRVQVTGEAYFEVAHSVSPEGGGGKKPFIVDVLPFTGGVGGGRGAGCRIEALGTVFNVMAYGDEGVVKATLLNGKIKVILPSKASFATLLPGQQAHIQMTPLGDSITMVQQADTDVAIAWKKGYNAFKNADIKTIMRMLGRWYNVAVDYEGDIPGNKFTGAIPRSADLSTVLRMLQYAGIHLKTQGEKIIIIP